jgi:hypothetical protein
MIYIFSVSQYLGPMQVSLSRMVTDMVRFFLLFMLVLFAFSCGEFTCLLTTEQQTLICAVLPLFESLKYINLSTYVVDELKCKNCGIHEQHMTVIISMYIGNLCLFLYMSSIFESQTFRSILKALYKISTWDILLVYLYVCIFLTAKPFWTKFGMRSQHCKGHCCLSSMRIRYV